MLFVVVSGSSCVVRCALLGSCCALFVVCCCSLCIVYCSLFRVRCLALFDVRCSLCTVCCLICLGLSYVVVCCLVIGVWCCCGWRFLFHVFCLLFVYLCLLLVVVRCSLFVVRSRCVVFVVRLLFGVGCLVLCVVVCCIVWFVRCCSSFDNCWFCMVCLLFVVRRSLFVVSCFSLHVSHLLVCRRCCLLFGVRC